jgi:hypothetical protein
MNPMDTMKVRNNLLTPLNTLYEQPLNTLY